MSTEFPADDASSGTHPSTPLSLPPGFRYAGVAAGVKTSGKPDLALIATDRPAVAACMTTTNQIVAAPVLVCRQHAPTAHCRGIVINSGNANACTGTVGMNDAHAMCNRVAERLQCQPTDVLVMSTGVIGQTLPMPKVNAGIDQAAASLSDAPHAFMAAADAICTTDQFRKIATTRITLGDQTWTIAAMAKGAGMISPNMATMLGVILTDAPLSVDAASTVLSNVTERTFNRVSVDGHTSTNDTVVLATSGGADSSLEGEHLRQFTTAVHDVCLRLAKLLVADGEGAARFFEVSVTGAESDADAEVIARTVAASPLVKTAIYGGDPNWGRIVSAAGYAGPPMQVDQTCLRMNGILIYENGQPVPFDADQLSASMKRTDEVKVALVVGGGQGIARFWASDLSEDYVRFNSLYTT